MKGRSLLGFTISLTILEIGYFVLMLFPAIAQKVEQLPSAPGINISRVQYLRSETSADPKLERAILRQTGSRSYPLRYAYNKVDLNGDGNPEAIVSLRSPAFCGTGGCLTLIFQSDGNDYRSVVYEILSFGGIIVTPKRTSGWNDLITHYWDRDAKVIRYSVLRFNGREYAGTGNLPRNSTITGRVVLVSDDEHRLRP